MNRTMSICQAAPVAHMKNDIHYPVKMVERRSELIHLLLADAFSIPGKNLRLNLIDGSSNGGEEQLPSHTDMLLRR